MATNIKINSEELGAIISELQACNDMLNSASGYASKGVKKADRYCSIGFDTALIMDHLDKQLASTFGVGIMNLQAVLFKYATTDAKNKIQAENIKDVQGIPVSPENNSNSGINHSSSDNDIKTNNIIVPAGQITSEPAVFGTWTSLCSVMAFATALSIIKGHTTNQQDYILYFTKKDGSQSRKCSFKDNETGKQYSEVAIDWNRIVESVKSGKPVIINYKYDAIKNNGTHKNSNHYVVITGFADDFDPQNINENSFKVIDSNDGKEKSFSQIVSSYKSFELTKQTTAIYFD